MNDQPDICNLLLSIANNTVARINQILADERSDVEKELYEEATTYLTKAFKAYGRVLGSLPPGPDGKGRTE